MARATLLALLLIALAAGGCQKQVDVQTYKKERALPGKKNLRSPALSKESKNEKVQRSLARIREVR